MNGMGMQDEGQGDAQDQGIPQAPQSKMEKMGQLMQMMDAMQGLVASIMQEESGETNEPGSMKMSAMGGGNKPGMGMQ